MQKINYQPVQPAIVESLKDIRGEAYVIFDNQKTLIHDSAGIITRLCEQHGAVEVHPATTDQQIERFWKIRKQIPWVLKRHGEHQSIEDIVVPMANIPKILQHLNKLAQQYNVLIPVFGHAGDGNLHAHPMKRPDQSPQDWEEMLPQLLKDIYVATAKLGGTISGEHGIGHKRKDYMDLVMGDAHLALMRKIKAALDPNHILNPGKIFNI